MSPPDAFLSITTINKYIPKVKFAWIIFDNILDGKRARKPRRSVAGSELRRMMTMGLLRVNVIGARFRAGDGDLSNGHQIRILQRRLSNNAVIRMRRGDDPARIAEIMKMRSPIAGLIEERPRGPLIAGQPEDVESANLGAISGLDQSQIFIPEMIVIPAGKAIIGSKDGLYERPLRRVTISTFKIGKYPITNEEYRRYLEVTGQPIPALMDNTAMARHPAVNVSGNDSRAFVDWLSSITGRKFRLPTEAEGEYAARGIDGRTYPWGNDWGKSHGLSHSSNHSSKLTYASNGTESVDSHPEGASPFGVMHLSGNVWEWRADWFSKYRITDLVDPKGPEKGNFKVLRGGSWFDYRVYSFRSAFRHADRPDRRDDRIGFRIAEDIVTE